MFIALVNVPLLKPADRDIPKRAEVHESKGDVQKCAVFVREQRPPLTFDSRVFRIHPCVDAANPCSSGDPASPRKNRSVGGLLCRLFRPEHGDKNTEARRRNLKLTEGSVQTVTTTRKGGGRRSLVMKTTIYINIAG